MTGLFNRLSPTGWEMLLGFLISCTCAAINVFLQPNQVVGVTLLLVGVAAMNVFFANWLLPEPDGHVLLPIKRWWKDFSAPAQIGTFEGRSVLEKWVLMDFRYIYDASGRLVATEQEIDWSSTDDQWHWGEPKHIEMIVTHCDGSERLSLLSRFRSPKLSNARAEILNHNDEVVGHTTYSAK